MASNVACSSSCLLYTSPEINLLGKTVDEAIAELDKYLDDAYLAHLSSVRVVHGKGTGALRSGCLLYTSHRRAFRFLGLLDLFAGVLGKCSGQRIGVTAFEKDQVLGWGATAVFLHRIVHTIFPGDLLKLLDRLSLIHILAA